MIGHVLKIFRYAKVGEMFRIKYFLDDKMWSVVEGAFNKFPIDKREVNLTTKLARWVFPYMFFLLIPRGR